MEFGELLIYSVSFFGIFTSIYFFLTLTENRHRLSNPKPGKNLPGVTAIIPAYNEESTIEKTIQSLLNLNYPKNKLDIIIVDDGSSDNTYTISKRYESYQVTVIKKKNGGKASALNLALKKCRTEFVGALDADSFVSPDSLKRMIGFFNNKQVMAVTPSLKVYRPKGLLQKIQMIEYLIGIFLRKTFALLGSIHVTPGPFTIYRKKFFVDYGGYDENNLTEDIEIALRIQTNNFIIENSSDAIVYTIAPDKWNILYRQRLRWYMGFTQNVLNYKKLFSREHGNLGIIILPSSFISIILVSSMLLYTLYSFVDRSIKNIINLNNINFDIWSIFNPSFDLFYMNLGIITVIGVFSFIASIMMIWSAKILSDEEEKIKIPYILFLIFYWPLYGLWWIMSTLYLLKGKKIDWGHKSINRKNPKDYKNHKTITIR